MTEAHVDDKGCGPGKGKARESIIDQYFTYLQE
jgi:hypothetical protein